MPYDVHLISRIKAFLSPVYIFKYGFEMNVYRHTNAHNLT